MTGRSIANAPSYFTMLGKQLTGWTAKRRVVVLRRKQQRRMEKESSHELGWPLLAEGDPVPEYEYQVLVTNLSEELLRLRARPSSVRISARDISRSSRSPRVPAFAPCRSRKSVAPSARTRCPPRENDAGIKHGFENDASRGTNTGCDCVTGCD